MRVGIASRSTCVELDVRGRDGGELFYLAAIGVVELNGHRGTILELGPNWCIESSVGGIPPSVNWLIFKVRLDALGQSPKRFGREPRFKLLDADDRHGCDSFSFADKA